MADSFRSRLSDAARAVVSSSLWAPGQATVTPDAEKASGIWGPAWRSFMGIEDGTQEITDSPGDRAAAHTAESYVYRCIDVRGKALTQVPLRMWQTDTEGRRKAIDGHEALSLLESPNPLGWVDDEGAMGRFTMAALDLHGFSTCRLTFNGRGVPKELYWLPPTSVQPLHGYDVGDISIPFAGVRYTTGSGVQTLGPDEILYFATDNFADPIIGTSRISVLKTAINLRMYSQRSNVDFFKNSMRPDWILSGNFANTEDNVERIKRSVRRHISGENNRMPLVLGEGASAHLLTMSQKDAEWLAQQRLSMEEVFAIFGVPTIYGNNLDRATYDNIKTAKLILWHDTMIPEADQMAKWWTRRLLWKYWPDARAKRIEFGYDYTAIEGLGEDLALVWERFMSYMQRLDAMVNDRQMTPNQARLALEQFADELGVNSDPWKGTVVGGDTFYLPYTNVPVDQLSIQANIDLKEAGSYSQDPALIEDVPGATDIGDRAKLVDTPPPATPATDPAPPKKPKKAVVKVVTKLPDPKPVLERRLAPIQADLVKDLKKHFQGLMSESLRNLRKSHDGAETKDALPDADLLYDHEAAKKGLVQLITDAAALAAEQAYAASADDFGLSVTWSAENPWLPDYIGQRIPLINGIDDTTAAALRNALLDGAQAGESMLQLADRVTGAFREAIDYRAELIARTETVMAYAASALQSYNEANVTEVEISDGSGLGDECDARDGSVVGLDEAEAIMGASHPQCTLCFLPVVGVPGEQLGYSIGPGIRLVA